MIFSSNLPHSLNMLTFPQHHFLLVVVTEHKPSVWQQRDLL